MKLETAVEIITMNKDELWHRWGNRLSITKIKNGWLIMHSESTGMYTTHVIEKKKEYLVGPTELLWNGF